VATRANSPPPKKTKFSTTLPFGRFDEDLVQQFWRDDILQRTAKHDTRGTLLDEPIYHFPNIIVLPP